MRFSHNKLLGAALLLVLTPLASATTWYVNGVSGSDFNNCPAPTIKKALSLASSGDTIMVAAATYTENLTIGISVTIVGSGASTAIIDGGGVNKVITISSTAHVSLSKVTIRHGTAVYGAGITNSGTLTLNYSAVTGNLAYHWGGGMWNGGTLAINSSTISGNTASVSCTTPIVCHTNGGASSTMPAHLRSTTAPSAGIPPRPVALAELFASAMRAASSTMRC
jgi:hypothetical protein